MVEVHLERDLAFPAARVWAVLEDYGNMEWAMGPPRVEVIGEGIGMTRRILMDGMEPIDEVLESMDPDTMSFSYAIPRGLPLPLTDYRSRARVEALAEGGSRIYWSCQCTPTDAAMSAEDTESLMHATYNALIDSLEKFLNKQEQL
jgi:hypothetical protein